MTTPHRTLQMALDALDAITDDVDGTGLNTMPSFDKAIDAIAALREALAQPEPIDGFGGNLDDAFEPAAPTPAVPDDAALNTLAKLFHRGEEIEGDDGAAMMVDLSLWHEASEAFDSLIGDGDGETLASSAAPAVREPLTDARKLCTCDGAGRGPGRACVVQAGGRLGDLWKCAKSAAPAVPRHVRKIGEECAELSKVCSRITIQGLDGVDPATSETNRAALAKEIADVIAQCYMTISAFGLDDHAIRVRGFEKQRQMAEWEAMFQPPAADQPWSPRVGELVRYGDGSTALALHGEPHAGGWHGKQCMGGHTFYTRVYPPTEQDRRQWVENAVRWRGVSLELARAEAGLDTPGGGK